MRILQVSPRYYSSIGGVEYTVKKLVEGMKARGHEVTVVCGDSSTKDVEVVEEDGVEVAKVPTYAPSNAFHIPKDRSIVKRFMGNDVDVIHTHSVHAVISLLPMSFKKSLKPKWRLVYTLHFSTPGYTFFRRFLWKLFWKNRVNSGLRYVDAIHSTSVLESNVIVKQFGNACGKVVLIPLGLDDDVFSVGWKGSESDYVLYCGRIERYKRLDFALKAIELVRKRGYNMKFIIVGEGSISSHFKKMSEENKWVVYMQPRQREEYLRLLANARAVINLSSAENFNFFLAEACAIGVPIIATPEAAAFCPEFANVKSLKTEVVADMVTRVILKPENYVLPKTCAPKPWKDVIAEFEEFYVKVSGS